MNSQRDRIVASRADERIRCSRTLNHLMSHSFEENSPCARLDMRLVGSS